MIIANKKDQKYEHKVHFPLLLIILDVGVAIVYEIGKDFRMAT